MVQFPVETLLSERDSECIDLTTETFYFNAEILGNEKVKELLGICYSLLFIFKTCIFKTRKCQCQLCIEK